MRKAGAAAAIVLTGALGTSALAATTVPTVSHLKAKPHTFCVKRSHRCRHPGTTVSFKLDQAARVRLDMRRYHGTTGPIVEFVRSFGAGEHSVKLRDRHLQRDRWWMRIQPTNSVGSGGIQQIVVRVVKHRG